MQAIILHRKTVALLEERFSPFSDWLAQSATATGLVLTFPDGSLQISEEVAFRDVHRLLVASRLLGSVLTGKCFFRSLSPFPLCLYHLISTADYQARLGENFFFNGQSPALPGESPGERNLEALLVTVGFRRRLNADLRRTFCAAVRGWADSVKERGIFGDNRASLASPGIEYRGTRAQFRVNALESGQDTLNWLSLSVLNFGYDVHTVEGVKFAAEENLDTCFGPAPKKAVFVEFPVEVVSDAAPPQKFDSRAVVPVDAVPCSAIPSGRFPVLEVFGYAWSSFSIKVSFSRLLSHDEREEFDELVMSWLNLGRYGAYGGIGIHSHHAIQHDEDEDSASVQVDMGDSEPATSLKILIKALEGFDAVSAPIECVSFA